MALRVLISGAGIAGPSVGWFLSKKCGSKVTIVERTRSLLPHGQNVDIQGTARKVIDKMGLTDQVRKSNTTEEGTRFIDPNGKPFAPFPMKEGKSASFTSEYEILRGDLAAILHNNTKDHPNVNYMFDTTIKNVISNDEDKVMVEFSDGKTQEFDLLIVADGQWSKTRRQCFPPESVKVIDKGMYVAYWTIPRLPSDDNCWNVYMALKSRVITLRPDPHGTIRAMASYMPYNEEEKKEWMIASKSNKKAQEEILRKYFGDAGWQSQRILDDIDSAPDFYFQAIQQIRMTKWHNSRVVCLGDTAYAPTPLTGMGTSLAITGGYILAGELSKLVDGENPARALEAYENVFRPFVEQSQSIPSFVPAVAHPYSEWKRWIFNSSISVVSKLVAIPWLIKKFDDDRNVDDFPLPTYPKFEDKE